MNTKLTPKQKKEYIRILQGAAELILAHGFTYCCIAIEKLQGWRENTPAYLAFESLYFKDCAGVKGRDKMTGRRNYKAWWGMDCEDREARILALLLAAEVVRTNSLP